MLKRTVFVSLAALAISSPALAIEIPTDAGISFAQKSTAYPSASFNKFLEACGATLAPEAVASIPASYAKAGDSSVMFNDEATAYTPLNYDKILTAYGLVINPEKVTENNVPSYATVVGGEVVFGDIKKIAYDGDEWTRIFAMYDLPAIDGDDDMDGVLNSRDLCPDTPRGVKVNEDGCWVHTGVLFDFDKATLKPEYKQELQGAPKIFAENPDLQVTVEGHTDSVGTDMYNQKLSERRARAVVNYLESLGVPASQLSSVGYGESDPVASNATPEGRAKNRRVVFSPNRK
ncbi:MAG: OmpA family protein [Desulfopila sp.]